MHDGHSNGAKNGDDTTRSAGLSVADLRLLQAIAAVLEEERGNPTKSFTDSSPLEKLAPGETDSLVATGLLSRNGDHKTASPTMTPLGTSICAAAMRAVRTLLNERSAVNPRWNPQTRTLTYGDKIVKQCRKTAPNQEALLARFEMFGWPERIADPLPETEDIVPQDRLRETIKQLNRTIDTSVLRFAGDGSGRGVRWIAMDDV